eukprot:TRINITY_DN13227_c0_g1_i2.p2 TRINITY_DN13227_c0_g1~~TRINITY_DN13227_c0_g1_i2.p2  ORF type:complete len:447 (+),score=114.18 TRINITY_DN13227_c0_g1_i2:81-1421(+)
MVLGPGGTSMWPPSAQSPHPQQQHQQQHGRDGGASWSGFAPPPPTGSAYGAYWGPQGTPGHTGAPAAPPHMPLHHAPQPPMAPGQQQQLWGGSPYSHAYGASWAPYGQPLSGPMGWAPPPPQRHQQPHHQQPHHQQPHHQQPALQNWGAAGAVKAPPAQSRPPPQQQLQQYADPGRLPVGAPPQRPPSPVDSVVSHFTSRLLLRHYRDGSVGAADPDRAACVAAFRAMIELLHVASQASEPVTRVSFQQSCEQFSQRWDSHAHWLNAKMLGPFLEKLMPKLQFTGDFNGGPVHPPASVGTAAAATGKPAAPAPSSAGAVRLADARPGGGGAASKAGRQPAPAARNQATVSLAGLDIKAGGSKRAQLRKQKDEERKRKEAGRRLKQEEEAAADTAEAAPQEGAPAAEEPAAETREDEHQDAAQEATPEEAPAEQPDSDDLGDITQFL